VTSFNKQATDKNATWFERDDRKDRAAAVVAIDIKRLEENGERNNKVNK